MSRSSRKPVATIVSSGIAFVPAAMSPAPTPTQHQVPGLRAPAGVPATAQGFARVLDQVAPSRSEAPAEVMDAAPASSRPDRTAPPDATSSRRGGADEARMPPAEATPPPREGAGATAAAATSPARTATGVKTPRPDSPETEPGTPDAATMAAAFAGNGPAPIPTLPGLPPTTPALPTNPDSAAAGEMAAQAPAPAIEGAIPTGLTAPSPVPAEGSQPSPGEEALATGAPMPCPGLPSGPGRPGPDMAARPARAPRGSGGADRAQAGADPSAAAQSPSGSARPVEIARPAGPGQTNFPPAQEDPASGSRFEIGSVAPVPGAPSRLDPAVVPVPQPGPGMTAPPTFSPAPGSAAYAATAPSLAGQIVPGLVTMGVQPAAGGAPARLSVALRPLELGRLDIAVERGRDGGARIHVLAERPETLALLQRDAAILVAALEQAGLGGTGGTLDLGLARQESGQSGGAAAGGEGQGGQAPAGRGQGQDKRGRPASPPQHSGSRSLRGLLDIAL
ncbi:flagellar hook-length control protein FliK [Roseicella aquatilis]|uniref:Flagellar hook-length control protein FliK n=1 Tax=Roseicella aquatilis TaxID=2527868 RepID=A0A4V2WKB4_9PROT|nr:flagellar hook-length control protein FliK [Roseicella aquatilis]